MRIKGAVRVVGVDDSIAEVVPLLVKRWRELAFDDDGVVLVDGRRREGLAVAEGEHPQPGARYEIVTAGERPGHYVAEVVDDTPTELRVRVERAGDVPIDLTVAKPGSKIDATFGGNLDGGWPLAGSVQGSATVTPSGMVASIRHQRVLADVTAAVRPDWTIDVEADVRGKGLLRPLMAPLLWIRGKRALAQALQRGADDIKALADRLGSPLDPRVVADEIADDFLSDVVPYKLRT